MSHVAWSVFVWVCLCGGCEGVCVLSTRVSYLKTVKPIKMPFGGLTYVDPRNHYVRLASKSDESIRRHEE